MYVCVYFVILLFFNYLCKKDNLPAENLRNKIYRFFFHLLHFKW